MKKQLIFILITIGFLESCNNSVSNHDERTTDFSEENEIVNIAFDAMVGPDTLWTKYLLIPPLFIPPNGIQTKQEKIEYQKDSIKNDSLKSALDTANLYVFIKDSLIKFQEDNNLLKSIKDPNLFRSDFPDIDMNFRTLLIKLIDSSISRPFDIYYLKSKFKYKVYYLKNIEKYPGNIIKIGEVKMSRPIFNNNKTMACIYSEIICGGECGGGSILFFVKVYGQWRIKGQKQLWVS